jgi:probable addiction module antidote protein
MTIKTYPFDTADYLKSEEEMESYLNFCLEDGDPALIAYAIGAVARAKSMTKVAKDTQLGRESLYKSLSAEGNPSFTTVLKVLTSFGLKLSVSSAATSSK